MKRILTYIAVVAITALTFSCEFEVEPTPTYNKSNGEVTVTSSTTTVAVSANDSLKEVVSLTWTDPGYVVGLDNTKFSVRIAKSGTNFSSFISKDFTGELGASLIGRDLNGAAYKFGAQAGEAMELELMVVAMHSNNNEQKTSNVLKITVTTFSDLGLAASASSIVLSSETADEEAISLSWTSAFKGFSAVKIYELQHAVGGTSFANPVTETVTTFEKVYTHKDLNDIALGYGFVPNTENTIDFRIRVTNELGKEVISNVITVTVTPYATSFPPLYGMGEALKGWGPWPDNAVELVSTEYKKYFGYLYLTQDKAFRFFDQLDWEPTSYNYPYFTSVADKFVNASDGDSNFKFVGTTGWYKVSVDLLAKTVTIEDAQEPVLYMTGEALNGWNWANPVQLTYVKTGVFKSSATFKNNQTFRFFGQAGWDPVSYNYLYFESVDPLFEDAQDGDRNLKFTGETGSYDIVVDLIQKVVTVLPSNLYMTGAALNGWNWDNDIQLTRTEAGVFESTATFKSGETFRFFAQPDWGPTSFNYPYFVSVASDFENGNDDDQNLRFTGTEGEHKIIVNLVTKTVTLE